ncbi:unnamed protein product, partial [Linum tenue]
AGITSGLIRFSNSLSGATSGAFGGGGAVFSGLAPFPGVPVSAFFSVTKNHRVSHADSIQIIAIEIVGRENFHDVISVVLNLNHLHVLLQLGLPVDMLVLVFWRLDLDVVREENG